VRILRRHFDPAKNRVHIISLSCNEVPPARYGGIELIVANLCEGLAARGVQTVCYSPGELRLNGVDHVQTLSEPSLGPKDGGQANTDAHLRAVASGLRVRLRRSDVIVFNHPDHYRRLKWRLGVRIRALAHLVEVAHWTDAGLRQNVIFPSAALRDYLNLPGVVIPHGERLHFAEKTGDRGEFLFFAGRITKDKGVDIALRAAEMLGVRLVLAGPLNDKEFAQQIIHHPLVDYLGELTYQELVPYYARARAMVYLTQYIEPFGLSVIEAMAAGCPVITTGKGGTGETVIDGVTGFHCQTADQVAAAYQKLALISTGACVQRAREYTIERMSAAYCSYFTTL
jgi:glycosyltransferase involved in cell wall biosynthesis